MINKKNNSLMIGYIGLGFMILGYLNLIREIPDEFLIGISFSAGFFAVAELIVKYQPLNRFVYYLHSCFVFGGVASFIVLPPLLLTIPGSTAILTDNSEAITIISLGVVLITMSIDNNNTE